MKKTYRGFHNKRKKKWKIYKIFINVALQTILNDFFPISAMEVGNIHLSKLLSKDLGPKFSLKQPFDPLFECVYVSVCWPPPLHSETV